MKLFSEKTLVLVAVLVLIAYGIISSTAFIVSEYETVMITRLGEPVRQIDTAGINFKLPFVETSHVFEKRILEWDSKAMECPTKDKLYIVVDCFARWKICDPKLYYTSLGDERSALSRLDDILGSETRTAVATHELVEIIRTTKGRVPTRDEDLEKSGAVLAASLPAIQFGRTKIEHEIGERSKEKLRAFGIELLDIRFKRQSYSSSVAKKISERMISERRQIASRFRSEGQGEAAKVLGLREKDVATIQSTANKQALATEGTADAKAAGTYNTAYSQPDAQDFYLFVRSLDVAKNAFQGQTTVVLSTASDLTRMFKTLGEATAKP